MLYVLYVLTGLAFAFVVVTLIFGTAAMSKKTQENRKKSNDWMWRRIYAQVAAICLLALTVYVKKNGG
jgi:TRAP-type mannitol/chloroaromatic compound transport system permease large subunit